MNLHTAEVSSKKKLTERIYELNLRMVEPDLMPFKAGQCVGFVIRDNVKRLYSFASIPERGNELTFCVDVSPMGEGSMFVLGLNDGDRVTLEGPYGAFTVKDKDRDLLFVATGAGVAPFKSIIEDLLRNGYGKKATLVFGVRHESDFFYFDFFSALDAVYPNFTFLPALSRPEPHWQGIKGRVTEYLKENSGLYNDHLVYICGSPEMVKDTRAVLLEKGFPSKDIRVEIFT